MEIKVEKLSKSFDEKKILDEISFEMSNGIIAFLGNNGAGKTTLINIIVGLLEEDSGNIYFDGKDIKSNRMLFRKNLGFLPQDCSYYDGYTGIQFLKYIAALKDVDKAKASKRIEKLMKTVNLWEHKDKKIGKYSGGMKHRLGICQAMLNMPKCLILDEPTTGLDYSERQIFKKLIENYSKNHIVIISTHILSDIDYITDQVILLKDSRLLINDKNCKGISISNEYGSYLGRV